MDSANHTTSRDYHCFFCRLSIIYNPRISFINFDQQQVRLLDSCSGSENKIFLSLTVDHLGAGDSGILRQLLFSIIIFLIQWISPSYFLWKSGFCSIQELFLSKLWTLRLNFRCYYFIPLFTESFTVTAMPKKSPISVSKSHISSESCSIHIFPGDLLEESKWNHRNSSVFSKWSSLCLKL